jgi:polyhydroxybutyrate depolymerase
MPDGVRRRGLFGGRSWNAGGGRDGFRCVGGEACATDSDDVAYFDDLLAEVRRAVVTHDDQVFATGISNGGAMSHRLACERSEVVAAIATIAGAAQVQATPGCAPSRAVPVLHVHGTEDPCWGYDGSISERLCDDGTGGRFVSVPDSMAGWLERNGCDGTDLDDMTRETMPDAQDDGTRSTRFRGVDCDADTEHVRIDGGGHTWPSGWDYLAERRIGKVAQDFDGNQLVWAFLEAHPLPPTPVDFD